MTPYLLRRIVLLGPTILGITFIVFAIVRFLPGDVVDQMVLATDVTGGVPDPDMRRRLEEKYSLDQSIPKQYLSWLGGLAVGNVGDSIISGRPVLSEISARMPVTAELGILALSFSVLIGLPIGVLSAVKQNSFTDYAARAVAVLLIALPSFWVAMMVITLGFSIFGWVPPLRYKSVVVSPQENLAIMIPPALVLGAYLSGAIMRMSRSSVLDVVRQDYVRTARAKGLRGSVVTWRHVLRNALIPIVTIIGLQIPIVLGGTVLLERVFSLPGMGSYLVTSIQVRDYPVVQGLVLLSAALVVGANLLVDLSYAIIDPRLRHT